MIRMELVVTCSSCGAKTAFQGVVSREATCEQCRAYLHSCRNCRFYDPTAYNECSEPMAERVVEKESANFCDYFAPSSETAVGNHSESKSQAKEVLEKLFKKN